MEEFKVNDLFNKYCKAIGWAEQLIQEIPGDCRFYKYKETLEKQLLYFQDPTNIKESSSEEMKEHLEANLEAFVLVEIYKKFAGRIDDGFKNKLKESLMGPLCAVDEEDCGNKSKNGFGRNVQSELILASKVKDAKILKFVGSDFVYDLGESKFGVECKRIHSELKIIKRFIKACQQIENNPDIEYGLVAFRMDKYIFWKEVSGLILPSPVLRERKDLILKVNNYNEMHLWFRNQIETFGKVFQTRFAQIINKKGYKKVAGYCVFSYLPFLVGNPSTIVSAGDSLVVEFEYAGEVRRKEIFNKFLSVLKFD